MKKQYEILNPIKYAGKVTKSGTIELPAEVGDPLAASGTLRDLTAVLPAKRPKSKAKNTQSSAQTDNPTGTDAGEPASDANDSAPSGADDGAPAPPAGADVPSNADAPAPNKPKARRSRAKTTAKKTGA